MLFTMAWRNMWRNKRRTLITAASVFFAVLLSVFMSSLQQGSWERMIGNLLGYYSGYVQIHKEGYWDDKIPDNSFGAADSLLGVVQNNKEVKKVAPRLENFVLSASRKHTRGAMVVGIDPKLEAAFTHLDQKVESGRFLQSGGKGCLMASGLADYLNLGVGDTLILLGQGYHGVSAAGRYPVTGIVKFGSPELDKNLLYISIENARVLFGMQDRLTALVIEPRNTDKLEDFTAGLSLALNGEADSGNATSAYEVMDWKTLMPEIYQAYQADTAGGLVMLMILYLVIAFGILGTVLMMTMERQYEFGVLVAIGMKRLRLSVVVMLESLMIALLGTLAGVGISIPLVLYYVQHPIPLSGKLAESYESFGFEPVIAFTSRPGIFWGQALVVFIIAVVMSSYPIFKLSRLNPVKAMRN